MSDARPAGRILDLLRLAAGLGVVGGALDVATVLLRRAWLGQFTARSRDVLWLAPLGYVLVFALGALLLGLIAWRRPRFPALWLTVFAAAAGIALSVTFLLLGQRLHPAALGLLALGLGAQAARLAAAREAATLRLARRAAPWLLVALLAVAAVQLGGRARRERQAAAALPAAAPGAPNILFLVLDTVRAASLSLYGHPRPTSPELERLGREGVVFDQALAPAPWTLPSHASMFTGRWPHELSTGWFRPLDARDSTLAEALAARGYRTGGFVANLIYTDYEKGLARGFQRYEDFPLGLATLLRSCTLTRRLSDTRAFRRWLGTDQVLGRKHAAVVNAEFLDWQATTGERPFFAFLNYFDAHDPYLPPDDWFRRIAGHDRPSHLSPFRRLGMAGRHAGMRPADVQLERDAYEASIAWLDDAIRQLLDSLEARGVLANTIVVVTSDHGEEFGEHGAYLHGHTLFRDAVHVPLLLWAPGRVPAARRVARPVSLRDLPATLLEFTPAAGSAFPGRPLQRFFGDSVPAPEAPVLTEVQKAIRMPEWYPGAHGALRSLTDTAYQFIQHADGSHQLFAWPTDPEERENLYRSPPGRALAEGYLALLREVAEFPPDGPASELP
ncbi:MAG: sulfatase [Gemmatimonadetes bacterium]|nr:sulfatase [Gemmatimonadota bacterium]